MNPVLPVGSATYLVSYEEARTAAKTRRSVSEVKDLRSRDTRDVGVMHGRGQFDLMSRRPSGRLGDSADLRQSCDRVDLDLGRYVHAECECSHEDEFDRGEVVQDIVDVFSKPFGIFLPIEDGLHGFRVPGEILRDVQSAKFSADTRESVRHPSAAARLTGQAAGGCRSCSAW